MKKTIVFIRSAVALLVVAFSACRPDPEVVPTTPEPISFEVPKDWPQPHYKFENNTLTPAGFELGRRLFYDPRLSKDNTISCGSCHQQFAAFAQLDHDVSHGVNGLLGNRNSPALFNLNWHTSFFWDGGVTHIENQPINPIQNPVEMAEKIENVVVKLEGDAAYRKRFKDAFGDETVNSQRIFRALAQFMGMMVSSNSKYDRYTRGESGGTLTPEELNGLNVCKRKCMSCHTPPLFSDFTFRNNGLSPNSTNDSGRGHITKDGADNYKFLIPSLRNLKYTAPYMHDGRFATLDEVLNHYMGVHPSPTLDPMLKNGISLSAKDRDDLLTFLNTLNDESFVKDTRFSEPKD